MKIKRDTTYNQNAKPFIRENMNSWIPPTFQAMTLWPVFAGDSRYTKGYWVSHNHFENLDIQIVQEGNLKIYYDGGISLLKPGELGLIPFGSHKPVSYTHLPQRRAIESLPEKSAESTNSCFP